MWWKEQKNHERKVQQLINRQARAITGMYPSSPIQPLLSEAGLVPDHILLDHRQRMYTYRLLSQPEDHPAKKILQLVLEKEMKIPSLETNPRIRFYGLVVIKLVHTDSGLLVDRADGVESVERLWRLQEIPIHVIIEPAEKAVQEAKLYRAGKIFWTDGSKLNSGKSGAAVVWKDTRLDKW